MRRASVRAALLLAIGWAAFRYANHVPAVVPDSAPANTFSAARAMEHVRAIAARPHPIGSAEHRAVAEYVLGQLRALGLEPRVQEATGIGTRYPVAGRVRNIVVRLAGASGATPRPAVLLMAHYDAVPAAPGAGDDASGTAVLLETLRALTAGPRLRHDVIALFTDGEETGLLGAAAFVREHPWAPDVAVTLNFEARGTRGPSLMFETGPGNLDVLRVLRRIGGARATSLSTFVYRRLPNDTDLSELARLGTPALNFAFIDGVSRYHTAQDDVTHLDARSVQDHGHSALALARALASGDLPRPPTADAVFFDFPLLGLVVYPERWAGPLSLLLLVPLVLVLVNLRRQGRWIAGTLLGVAGTVVSVAVAVVAAVLAVRGLAAVHAFIGSGSPTRSGIYVAGVSVLAITIAGIVYAACRRWAGREPLRAGGAAVVALIAVVTSFVAPAVSFLFTWPALAVLSALAVRGAGPVRAVALWIATSVAVFVLLPIAYLMGAVALGLDATGASAVAVFSALGAWLVAHVLEPVEERPWVAPAAAGVIAVLLFAAGAASVRTHEGSPVGSSFAYGVDAEANTAYLGVQAATRAALHALRRELGDTPSVPPPAWFARYIPAAVPAPVPGPVATAGIRVVAESSDAGSAWVTVRILPPAGARAITLLADSGIVHSARVDGRPVDPSGYRYSPRGRWTLDYVAPPAEGFEIAVAVAPDRPAMLGLVSHTAGIPLVPGLQLPVRPPGVIPIQRGDYTLVYQRVRVR